MKYKILNNRVLVKVIQLSNIHSYLTYIYDEDFWVPWGRYGRDAALILNAVGDDPKRHSVHKSILTSDTTIVGVEYEIYYWWDGRTLKFDHIAHGK